MNDFFASIYEFFVYTQTYSMNLYENGTYLGLFLSMLLPALIIMAVFYFLIKHPFCSWVHWLILIGVAILFTGVLTYNILAENLAVYILSPVDYPDINSFITSFILYNVLLSIGTGIVFTFMFKQAPFPQRNVPFRG